MIKNVIFDLDGVIRGIKNTPLVEIIPRKYHKQYQGIGLCDFVAKYLPMDIFKEWDKGNVSAEDVLNEIIKVSDEPKEIIKLAFNAPLMLEHNYVYQETIQMIKKLKKSNFKLFILSNMCSEIVDILPKLFDMSLFDKAFFSCYVGTRKPDKQFYEESLKFFNINAKDSIFIDDNAKNLAPFEELGGYTYLFNNKKIYETINELELKIYS